jgi:hypothetical protein
MPRYRRWIFRKPKSYQKPQYTPRTRKIAKQKFADKPDSSYKVSRVNVPKSRQDNLFSAMVHAIIKAAVGNSRKKGTGGRG